MSSGKLGLHSENLSQKKERKNKILRFLVLQNPLVSGSFCFQARRPGLILRSHLVEEENPESQDHFELLSLHLIHASWQCMATHAHRKECFLKSDLKKKNKPCSFKTTTLLFTVGFRFIHLLLGWELKWMLFQLHFQVFYHVCIEVWLSLYTLFLDIGVYFLILVGPLLGTVLV